MKKQIRNSHSCCGGFITCGLVLLLPNIQAALVDKKTFGQSEDHILKSSRDFGRGYSDNSGKIKDHQ